MASMQDESIHLRLHLIWYTFIGKKIDYPLFSLANNKLFCQEIIFTAKIFDQRLFNSDNVRQPDFLQ